MIKISPQYIAGVADSDGSFTFMKRYGQSTTTGYFYRSIFQLTWSISNEAEDVMIFLKNKYGGSFSVCKKSTSFNSLKPSIFKYSVESNGLLKLINDIEPYLILKKERATLIKQHILYRKKRKPGLIKTKKEWEYEDDVYKKINLLNSKNKKL